MTAQEHETATSETPASADAPTTVEPLARTLVDVGRLWAAHGLGIGRAALETTATTLRTTASLLGVLAARVEPPRDETA
jgi:hypothetical protein